jgi:prepilin-type N-terminal cleavage/methylation domain-containing protein
MQKRFSGFTLIELSIVLVIIGLLLGTGMAALSNFLARAQVTEAEKQLQHIEAALIGYTISQQQLPCPDINDYPPVSPSFGSVADGIGDRTGGVCDDKSGYLPWVELGLPARDP